MKPVTFSLARQYHGDPAVLEERFPTPMHRAAAWMTRTTMVDPNAVVLSTVGGWDSDSRYVLIKRVDERGFWFFTSNTTSLYRQLSQNPSASLVWRDPGADLQMRAWGECDELPRTSVMRFWAARPFESRAMLFPNMDLTEIAAHCAKNPSWGHWVWAGFVLVPIELKFWVGRPGRAHLQKTWVRANKSTWSKLQ